MPAPLRDLPFICPQCSFETDSEETFRAHVWNSHLSNQQQEKSIPFHCQLYICSECSVSSTELDLVKLHSKTTHPTIRSSIVAHTMKIDYGNGQTREDEEEGTVFISHAAQSPIDNDFDDNVNMNSNSSNSANNTPPIIASSSSGASSITSQQNGASAEGCNLMVDTEMMDYDEPISASNQGLDQNNNSDHTSFLNSNINRTTSNTAAPVNSTATQILMNNLLLNGGLNLDRNQLQNQLNKFNSILASMTANQNSQSPCNNDNYRMRFGQNFPANPKINFGSKNDSQSSSNSGPQFNINGGCTGMTVHSSSSKHPLANGTGVGSADHNGNSSGIPGQDWSKIIARSEKKFVCLLCRQNLYNGRTEVVFHAVTRHLLKTEITRDLSKHGCLSARVKRVVGRLFVDGMRIRSGVHYKDAERVEAALFRSIELHLRYRDARDPDNSIPDEWNPDHGAHFKKVYTCSGCHARMPDSHLAFAHINDELRTSLPEFMRARSCPWSLSSREEWVWTVPDYTIQSLGEDKLQISSGIATPSGSQNDHFYVDPIPSPLPAPGISQSSSSSGLTQLGPNYVSRQNQTPLMAAAVAAAQSLCSSPQTPTINQTTASLTSQLLLSAAATAQQQQQQHQASQQQFIHKCHSFGNNEDLGSTALLRNLLAIISQNNASTGRSDCYFGDQTNYSTSPESPPIMNQQPETLTYQNVGANIPLSVALTALTKILPNLNGMVSTNSEPSDSPSPPAISLGAMGQNSHLTFVNALSRQE